MKSRFLLFAIALMLLSSTSYAKPHAKAVALSAEQQVRILQIDARVHEIKAMDLASLSRQERKALRKEVVQLKKRQLELQQEVFTFRLRLLLLLFYWCLF